MDIFPIIIIAVILNLLFGSIIEGKIIDRRQEKLDNSTTTDEE